MKGRRISAQEVEHSYNIQKYYLHQFGLDRSLTEHPSSFVDTSQMSPRLYHNSPSGLPRCQININMDNRGGET